MFIAAGCNDKRVYFFKKNSRIPLWSYETGGLVESVAISSDGNYVVAGGYDNNIYLFNVSQILNLNPSFFLLLLINQQFSIPDTLINPFFLIGLIGGILGGISLAVIITISIIKKKQ